MSANDATSGGIGSGMNSGGINDDIRKLQQSLVAHHQSLSTLLGNTTNPTDAQAILLEMQEVNFRIMVSGSLLFKQTTAAMDTRIEAVLAASADLDTSLKALTRVNDIVAATSKFLGQVDKVLDAIKLT
jgi:hypothetical protein